MASPTLKQESANAKMLGLIDSTATTSVTRLPVSLTAANQTVGGDTSYPPGWMGVASHTYGDTLATPGGFTLAAGDYPILVAGGTDRTSLTQGSRKPQPNALHEGGAQYFLPGPSFTNADPAVSQVVLKAAGGSFLTAAATANQTLTSTLASNFGYMTDIQLQLYVTSANASTVLILDASGGTTMFELQFAAAALGTTITESLFNFHFSAPLRTAAAGAAFFVTTTGAATQWAIQCNGFFSLF